MNADISGMLNYYGRRKITCLQTNDGYQLSSFEAKKYLRWCLKHGYTELKNAPDWDEYLKLTSKSKYNNNVKRLSAKS